MGAAISQWIHLRLQSCNAGFKSQPHHLFFFHLQSNVLLYLSWYREKDENKHKEACGQSYKHFTLVIYDSSVVIWGIFKSATPLESRVIIYERLATGLAHIKKEITILPDNRIGLFLLFIAFYQSASQAVRQKRSSNVVDPFLAFFKSFVTFKGLGVSSPSFCSNFCHNDPTLNQPSSTSGQCYKHFILKIMTLGS